MLGRARGLTAGRSEVADRLRRLARRPWWDDQTLTRSATLSLRYEEARAHGRCGRSPAVVESFEIAHGTFVTDDVTSVVCGEIFVTDGEIFVGDHEIFRANAEAFEKSDEKFVVGDEIFVANGENFAAGEPPNRSTAPKRRLSQSSALKGAARKRLGVTPSGVSVRNRPDAP